MTYLYCILCLLSGDEVLGKANIGRGKLHRMTRRGLVELRKVPRVKSGDSADMNTSGR